MSVCISRLPCLSELSYPIVGTCPASAGSPLNTMVPPGFMQAYINSNSGIMRVYKS